LLVLVSAAIFLRPGDPPTTQGDSAVASGIQEQTPVRPVGETPAAAPADPGLARAEVSESVASSDQQDAAPLLATQQSGVMAQAEDSGNPPVPETAENPTTPPAQPVREYPKILSFEEALASANAGDAYSQAVVSLYLGLGYKTAKNELRSKEYAMESARQRNPLGIFRLGEMRREGVAMTPNQKQASDLFKKALPSLTALEDDPYALAAVGRILELNGDLLGARNYYVMSAHAGYGPAQLKCAELFAKEDPDAGERYRAMAAEEGLFP
jgi:TPR repeat protein